MEISALIPLAWQAREQAYAPYSQFAVGAALLAEDGRVFTGCNVENLSYGLANCAERTAIFTAITAGARSFQQIVIVADTNEPISPCGACRQVMAEFAPDMKVLSVTKANVEFCSTVDALLPRAKTGILNH